MCGELNQILGGKLVMKYFTAITITSVYENPDDNELYPLVDEEGEEMIEDFFLVAGHPDSDDVLEMEEVAEVVNSKENGDIVLVTLDYSQLIHGRDDIDELTTEAIVSELDSLLDNMDAFSEKGEIELMQTEEVRIDVVPNYDPIDVDEQ